jgi:hypothetical protein
MAGQIQKTKTVAATVQKADTSNIVITYQGGQDAVSLETLNCTATQATGGDITKGVGVTGTALKVGTTIALNSPTAAFTGKNHVVTVAHFNDGTDQVILDTYV